MEFLEKLGANIAKKRGEAGLTQTELALRCDMDRSNMTRLEKGRTNPTVSTLKMIAEELKIKVQDLFDFE